MMQPASRWLAALGAVVSPNDIGRIKDWAFDARSFPIPAAVVLANFGHAAETNADAAGHRRLK
jgi:hypothetical protein